MANIVILTLGPLFTLAEVKAHLKVDVSDEDDLIGAYMSAAEMTVLQFCNVSLVPLGAEATFKVAALLVVSDLYENRSGSFGIPDAAKALLMPYRRYI